MLSSYANGINPVYSVSIVQSHLDEEVPQSFSHEERRAIEFDISVVYVNTPRVGQCNIGRLRSINRVRS
jgi:hypothetical protein